jgi:hypothetical protein
MVVRAVGSAVTMSGYLVAIVVMQAAGLVVPMLGRRIASLP